MQCYLQYSEGNILSRHLRPLYLPSMTSKREMLLDAISFLPFLPPSLTFKEEGCKFAELHLHMADSIPSHPHRELINHSQLLPISCLLHPGGTSQATKITVKCSDWVIVCQANIRLTSGQDQANIMLALHSHQAPAHDWWAIGFPWTLASLVATTMSSQP